MTIPFFELTTIAIGPLRLHVWGLFIALGILLFYVLLKRNCAFLAIRQRQQVLDMVFWAVLAGFVGARLAHVFFYDVSFYRLHPLEIFAVWDGGMSSAGAFIGGGVVCIRFFFKRLVPGAQLADAIARALPWSWAVGRIGCFLIHEHPARACTYCPVLQVFRDGAVGVDAALYEIGLWVVIGTVSILLTKAHFFERHGEKAILVAVLFFTGRFYLDFFRILDTRYGGLTPMQYTALCIVIASFFLLKNLPKKRSIDVL